MNKKIAALTTGAVLLFVFVAFFIYRTITKIAPAERAMPAAAVTGTDDKEALFAKAGRIESQGSIFKARQMYGGIIENFPDWKEIPKVQEALEDANVKLLFSSVETPDSIAYEVQKGDTLSGLAKRFNTTVELIMKANGLKTPSIRIGKKLKISKAKFSIIVDKSQNILTLKSGQDIIKTYKVSTGKNSCTPVGAFTITNKLVDPPWYPDSGGVIPYGDPRNVLGSRWMGISMKGYGIHGTTDPGAIGESVTDGCVRLNDSDVEELYAIVPVGTQVEIVD